MAADSYGRRAARQPPRHGGARIPAEALKAARGLARYADAATWPDADVAHEELLKDEESRLERHELRFGILCDLEVLWTEKGRWGEKGEPDEVLLRETAEFPERAAALFFPQHDEALERLRSFLALVHTVFLLAKALGENLPPDHDFAGLQRVRDDVERADGATASLVGMTDLEFFHLAMGFEASLLQGEKPTHQTEVMRGRGRRYIKAAPLRVSLALSRRELDHDRAPRRPRPRNYRRAGDRHATRRHSGVDPPDGEGDEPALAEVVPLFPRRRPKRQGIYSYAVLSPEARGAEVEPE